MEQQAPQLKVTLDPATEEQIFRMYLEIAQRAVEQATANIAVNNRYLNKEELKNYFKVGEATVQEWLRSGLKYAKIGRKVMFDMEEVEDFIDRNLKY